MYTFWSQIDGSGQLSSRKTVRGIRTNTLKASTDKIKVIETIDDQVGSYYFSPTLIASSSRRKQRPLYSAHPMGQTGSPFFDRAGSDRYSKDWSRSSMRAPQYKPINSTRVDTGQSSFRGRVRCQSHLVAWERRRREPGSNSVIVTASLTRCEGHVLRLGGVRRVRKIFAGCPAIRPIWDQSPGRSIVYGLRLLVTGSIHYTVKTASAAPRQRRKSKTVHAQRPDQIPPRAFHASNTPFAKPKRPTTGRGSPNDRKQTAGDARAGRNPEKNKARRQSIPSSPLPRWERARVRVTPQTQTPTVIPADSTVIPAQAGTQRKTKHAI